MSDKTVEEIVSDAKKPGTFNIINVLKEINHPTDTVNIYLDEQTAYDSSIIAERLKELEGFSSINGLDESDPEISEEIKAKKKELDSLVKKLEESKYIFTITGISEDKRKKLLDEAISVYPIEYEEKRTPITGEVAKVEIESDDRDSLFTDKLWASHITKIEAPNGDVQDSLSEPDAKALRASLPIASVAAITSAIEKLRVSTAVFLSTVDEDFLAKS